VQDLLPGYEHDIEPGAGLAIGPGADKVIIHTTESPRGSWGAIRNLWRGGPGQWNKGLPTFLADGTRVVQLLPLSTNAYTVENAPGGADTNRAGHVVQVEWCRYSADPWAEDEMAALAKWLVDLKANGLNFDWHNHPRFYGANEGIVLASYSSPIRFGADAFTNFNGWMGHQHVPENAHWDPGFLDAGRVANLCDQLAGPVASTPSEDEDVTVIARDKGYGAYACSGLFKRYIASDAEYQALKYIGCKDLGVNQGFLDLLTEVPRTKIAGV